MARAKKQVEEKPSEQASAIEEGTRSRKMLLPVVIIILIAISAVFFMFNTNEQDDLATAEITSKYGTIEEALREVGKIATRPDYLPQEVYQNLPPFP